MSHKNHLPVHVVLLWLYVLLTMVQAESFKIAAFNVQIFGKTKAAKAEVMKSLVQIIRRYDIILIQEIRDKSGDSVNQLLRDVNNEGNEQFDLVISERLGRTFLKEQYAFMYRKDGIQAVDTFQDPDPNDVFEREPFAVHFRCHKSVLKDFVLVGMHVDPDDAVAEINHLKSSHAQIKEHFNTDNILIMGDFNADCSYVPKKNLESLELRAEGFHWLIPDDADTTVSATDCAFDRFVMTGDDFIASVVPDSVQVVRFDVQLGLTEEQAKAVSDHYPIELSLRVDTKHSQIEDIGSGAAETACCGLCAMFHNLVSCFRK